MRSPNSNQNPETIRLKTRDRVAQFLVLFAFLMVSTAFANEHEAAPAAEHGAAPAEGEHGGGGEAKKAGPKAKADRYSEHESKLTSFMAKIRSLEKEIADMIESKHHVENGEKVKLLTQQIIFKHQDLAKVVKEYEEERLHVRFQHPDRDLEGEREYAAHPLKSLDEIEESFGLDGRLDRVRRQVSIVFPVKTKETKVNARKPASVKASDEDDDMPSNIHLVK